MVEQAAPGIQSSDGTGTLGKQRWLRIEFEFTLSSINRADMCGTFGDKTKNTLEAANPVVAAQPVDALRFVRASRVASKTCRGRTK
jgi:hypothetical protein